MLQQSLAQELIRRNLETKEDFLDLGNCGLNEFSEELAMLNECTHLKSLNLGTEYYDDDDKEKNTDNNGLQNIFKIVPAALPAWLEELQIRNAGIEEIANCENLEKLKVLDLSLNKIEKIKGLEKLTQLEELALHGNAINKIEGLESLLNLIILHLTRNQIEKIENLEVLTSLYELYLSANQIRKIENLSGLENLEFLDLNRNHISEIENLSAPNGFKLFDLNLSGNSIMEIRGLEYQDQLSILDLSENQIEQIKNLEPLKKLTILVLDGNKIKKIENLQENKLVNSFYIAYNKLESINNITDLISLETFYFYGNKVKKIKPLTKLENLQKIQIFGNPILDCPADVWETKDIKQIKAYFEKQDVSQGEILSTTTIEDLLHFKIVSKQDTAPIKDVKLILLGNSNTGKTNLVHYLQSNGFLNTRNSTHGLNVIRWTPDETRFPLLKNISISIWDFGGQEYYHEAYKLFLSANAVYAVLWEKGFDKNFRQITKVTDAEEEELEHFEKKYWLDTVRFYGESRESTPLLLVQNKVDSPEIKQRISQELYDEYSITECYHISLKEGINPTKATETRALQNFERELEMILANAADKAEIKPSWLIIRNEILKIQEAKRPAVSKNAFAPLIKENDGVWITTDKFNAACQQLSDNKLSENDLYTLPRWLDRCGAVVYFDKNPLLSDKVFINPQKLSAKIYEVLNKEVLANNGEFSKQDVASKNNFADTFIEIAKSLSLVFDHPDKLLKKDFFIAPQYLPAEHAIEDLFKIASSNAWQDCYWIKVPLFYYKKLLNHLILYYTADTGAAARYYWKHGIVFLKTIGAGNIRVMIKGLYPEEKQDEGVIMVGVENLDLTSKTAIQKEIMAQVIDFGKTFQKDTSTEAVKLVAGINTAEAQREATEKYYKESKYIKALKLSYDGNTYTSFNRLKELSSTNEQYFVDEESKEKISLHRFAPVLPFNINTARPKKVFISYSHQNTGWFNRLRVHLSGLRISRIIEEWTDKEIIAGEKWDKKIKDNMEAADVFICLLSPDFVASEYIWNTELKKIFEKLKEKRAQVIFIHIEPFDLGSIKFAAISTAPGGAAITDFEILPKDVNGQLKAASLWDNENEVLATIAIEIRRAIEKR